jgi:predicted ATPase
LVQDLNLQTVPDTLQGIIMARLDRLFEETRHTLQLASVVGRTFRYQVLSWLASAAALSVQLDSSLATLQRAELIRERARTP